METEIPYDFMPPEQHFGSPEELLSPINRYQQTRDLIDGDDRLENRERHLKNCEIYLNQLFLLHLSFIFHLNPQYLMSSDYMDYMEIGLIPPEGCETWIAPFAQEAFDKVIKPHKEIANIILGNVGKY